MTEANCKINWKSIRRLVVKDKTGVDPFTSGQSTFADVTTQVTTQSVWDAAIALTTVDRLTLSPKASNFVMPPVKPTIIDLADGTKQLSPVFPSNLLTMSFDGLNSSDHEALMLLIANGRDVLFLDFAGNTIGKTLTDAEVAAGGSIFFSSETFTTSTRGVTTGELDNVDVDANFGYDELVKFTIFQTGSFGLII